MDPGLLWQGFTSFNLHKSNDHMFEKVIFGIISIFMAGIAVTLLEGLGTLIFPIPSDIDTTDMESLRANVHRIPIGAKITVLIAHLAGAAAATHLGARLTRSVPVGLVCGGVMVLFVLFDLAMIPQPLWFSITDPLLALLGMFIGYKTLPLPLSER